MTKRDYLLYALANKLYYSRSWGLSVFGILLPSTDIPSELDKYYTANRDGKIYVSVDAELTQITDWKNDTALFNRDELVDLPAGTMACIKTDIKTTYGIAVINAILIEFPYRGAAPYINSEIKPNTLKGMEGDAETYKRFELGISFIRALAQTAVPSATRRSVTPNPMVAKVKPLLLEKYKDQLDNPVIVARIQDKLTALDDEYLKGDASERFLIKKKSKHSRLRLYGMVGAEQDFTDTSKISVMKPSLSEGWTAKELPMLINASIGGSFNRGHNTMLAGNDVKLTARAFQNYKIVKDTDCGTTKFMLRKINNINSRHLVGRYLINRSAPLTGDEVNNLMGTIIKLRSPSTCISPNTGICPVCAGDTLGNSKIGIPALVNAAISTFLGVYMALMHTQALSTERYNYMDRLS